jgi:hypothetical protein
MNGYEGRPADRDASDRDSDLGPPPAGACGLLAPAFCETFSQARPGGRGGDVDERRWSVSRFGVTNYGQGMAAYRAAVSGVDCNGATVQGLLPDGDLFVCADRSPPALMIAGPPQNTIDSLRARQPFAFPKGGKGTIVFDMGASVRDTGWSFRIWLTDEPKSQPEDSANGVEITIESDYVRAHTVANHAPTDLAPRSADIALSPLPTHFELTVQIGENGSIVLRTGDPDGGTPVQLASWVATIPSIESGYLHLQTGGSPAPSDPAHTQILTNVGFDGAFTPAPDVLEFPDALKRTDSVGVNVGYVMKCGTLLQLDAGRLPGVVTSARLSLASEAQYNSPTLAFRLSGAGTWTSLPLPISEYGIVTVSTAVDVSDLHDGTLELSCSNDAGDSAIVIDNIEIELLPF